MVLKLSLNEPSIYNIIRFKSIIVSNWQGIPMHHNKSYQNYVCRGYELMKVQSFIDR